MCYESWYQKKQVMDEEEKAKKEAEEAIEKARLTARKPKRPTESGAQPVAEREKVTS